MIAPQYQTKATIQQAVVKKRHVQLLLPHTTVQFDTPNSDCRPALEQFVSHCFRDTFNANIQGHLPYFLSAYNDDKLAAALGFQPVQTTQPIFLEQYLETSIEQAISSISNKIVSRANIVELGNLSSASRGFSEVLFIVIAAILHQAGYDWVVFTATQQVQKLVAKLKLETLLLGDADPTKLIDKGASWGQYYDSNPKVLAGDLHYGMTVLRSHRVASFMLNNYQYTINRYANSLAKLAH